MKRLLLVIKPFKVGAVARALTAAGAESVTLTEARGYGRQKGRLELYRDDPAAVSFLPKVRIECVVPNDCLQSVVDAATTAARTGRIGDGKLFVEEIG